MIRISLAAVSVFYSFFSSAQVFPPADYPRGYFRDPLSIPMSLAANFGELRPNHYHMGLDIRTQKKENLPVLAAADGAVAKVVIEPFGFGQAIYLRHPNGFTTVYAHLNEFFPALASYIRQQQYKRETWQGTFEIPPGLFPVKKGSLIAYSGNKGGSQGPHLHFEIRRTADDTNLNPLLFGLPVPDNTPPVIQRLAIYDREKSLYEQSPRILPVHKVVGGRAPALYSLAADLLTVTSPRASFAISAFDTQSGSANPNGIYQAILYDNDQPLIGFQMDNISYNDTRNINAHIDYKTRETGGPFLQHLSRLPGYAPPSVYRSPGQPAAGSPAAASISGSPAGSPTAASTAASPAGSTAGASTRKDAILPSFDGVIDLGDGGRHTIRIEVKDAYGNSSGLKFQVQYQPSSPGQPSPPVPGFPADPGKRFYPGMLDGYETSDCAFYIGEKSLYDSVFITYRVSGYPGAGISLPGAISAVHTIGAPFIPLQEPLLVRIRWAQPQEGPNDTSTRKQRTGKNWAAAIGERDSGGRDRVVMVGFDGNRKEVIKPEWQGGWASGRFREFGNFQLVEDKEAPVITPVGIYEGALLNKSSRIAFTVKDNLGAIRNFRAELDPPADGRSGKWLCFSNDKGAAFIYKFDEHCPPGKHLLKVTVEDVAGNRAIKEYNFTR